MADASRPDLRAGTIGRLTPAQRWILLHLLAGILGGAALIPDMLAFADTRFERGLLLPWISGTAVLALPSLLLWSAALPVVIYQAWELAPVAHPLAWVGATSLALFAAPWVLIAALSPVTYAVDPAAGALLVWTLYALAAFGVGSLWAAPIQWLAVRGRVRFLPWLKTAGPALGLAASVNLLGFSWGWEGSSIAWNLAIPVAALIYAVGTLPTLSGLLRQKDASPGPAGAL
jgi:hypothetical protein